MGKHKNNYKSKNGRYYVLKGSNAVMIAYNWDQANECFQKVHLLSKRQISHCSYFRCTARCAEPPQRLHPVFLFHSNCRLAVLSRSGRSCSST